mmetsp:Transcript_114976/g.279060  ORF Transcript_114976/g.279060 Transcript_114976/m.279060 type:complete len:214 (-) Transcript_114976:76-717(-)
MLAAVGLLGIAPCSLPIVPSDAAVHWWARSDSRRCWRHRGSWRSRWSRQSWFAALALMLAAVSLLERSPSSLPVVERDAAVHRRAGGSCRRCGRDRRWRCRRASLVLMLAAIGLLELSPSSLPVVPSDAAVHRWAGGSCRWRGRGNRCNLSWRWWCWRTPLVLVLATVGLLFDAPCGLPVAPRDTTIQRRAWRSRLVWAPSGGRPATPLLLLN